MNLRQSILNSFYLKTNTVAWKKRARLKKLQCRPHRRLDMRNLYTHINRARKVGYTYLSSYLAFLKSRCDVATELIATFSKSAPQILGVIHLIHQFVELSLHRQTRQNCEQAGKSCDKNSVILHSLQDFHRKNSNAFITEFPSLFPLLTCLALQ